jgi:hypothetical protein
MMKPLFLSLLLLPQLICAQQYAPADTMRSADTICFAAVGDLMLGSNYPGPEYLSPDDGALLLKPVWPWLRSADVAFGNVEGTIFKGPGTVKNCQDPTKCYAFRSPAHYTTHLNNAGFDLMSLANNHMGDFGEEGRRSTLRNLEKQGMAAAGLLIKPFAMIERKGLKIGLLAFAPNSGCLSLNNLEEAQKLVKRYRDSVDVLMVSFHGGAEGSGHRNVPKQKELFLGENRGDVYAFAHVMIDAGADLLLGHGPHVTRAVEVYKGRFIAYSMGNFCTYARFNLKGVNGMAPLLRIFTDRSGTFLYAHVIPTRQYGEGGPVLDPQGAVIQEIKTLTQTDFAGGGLRLESEFLLTPLPKTRVAP